VDLVEIELIGTEAEIVIVEEVETDVHEVQDVIPEAIQEVHQEVNIQDIQDVIVDRHWRDDQMKADQDLEQDHQREEQADHQEIVDQDQDQEQDHQKEKQVDHQEKIDRQKMVVLIVNHQKILMETVVLEVNHLDLVVEVDRQATKKNVLMATLMDNRTVVLKWMKVIMNKSFLNFTFDILKPYHTFNFYLFRIFNL